MIFLFYIMVMMVFVYLHHVITIVLFLYHGNDGIIYCIM